ncbi:inner membrane metabolite transport ygcS domain protein [Escherichia coli 6-319-05_S1_C1]|nr:inner membrane metabolite transport ygcS domain protein [Escherichia coli 6-319-05_S1_C1]
MNTSPVRMDDLPLNRFHCRIAALTFGAHRPTVMFSASLVTPLFSLRPPCN